MPAAAAEPASLDAILSTVERDNPTLKASRARWESMKLRVPQARAWEDPMVGFDIEREGTTRLDKYTDIEWMASQQIPVSGKNLSRGRVAEAEARATFQELRRVHLDVLTRARLAYFRLANAYAQLELNDRNRALLTQFSEISRVKYEAGTQSQGDLLTAETELARLGETRANLERDIVEQQSMLNALMDRPASYEIGRPAELKFVPFEPRSERLASAKLDTRPEVLLAGRRIEAARANLQLARRQWIPDPQIRVEARQFRESGGGIREYDTGLFFSVPWVNFRKYSAGVAEAKRGIEAAVEEQRAAEAEASALVRAQIEKIRAFARNYTLFRDNIVPLARQAVEATRAGYETDKNSFLELISARRSLHEVEATMLEHLANYRIAIAEMSAIVGEK